MQNGLAFRNRKSNMDRYERILEYFYQDLVRIAEKHGYKLHLVKEEAYHLCEEDIDFDDSEMAYRRRLFNYFFEHMDPSEYDVIIRELIELGYQIDYTNRYDFSSLPPQAIDITMLYGEVVLKAGDKWFAIGECINNHAEIIFRSTIPSSHNAGSSKPISLIEAPEMSIFRLYKPILVIKNIKKYERKLPKDRNMNVYCIDCGRKIIIELARYCAECGKPVCPSCITYCNKCNKPLCKECRYFGICHDCNGENQT